MVHRPDAKAAEETELCNLVAEVVEEEIQTFGRDIVLEVDADGLEDVFGQHTDELLTGNAGHGAGTDGEVDGGYRGGKGGRHDDLGHRGVVAKVGRDAKYHRNAPSG